MVICMFSSSVDALLNILLIYLSVLINIKHTSQFIFVYEHILCILVIPCNLNVQINYGAVSSAPSI